MSLMTSWICSFLSCSTGKAARSENSSVLFPDLWGCTKTRSQCQFTDSLSATLKVPACTMVQKVLTMFFTSITMCKFNSSLQFLLSRLFIEHFEEALSWGQQVWGVQQQTCEERRPDLGLDSWYQCLQFQ